MLLADVAADAVSTHLPWWAIILLPALGSVGGSVLSLLVTFWKLNKTEHHRRSARWEPMAEELWKERLKSYREYLTIYDATMQRMAGAVKETRETNLLLAALRSATADFHQATLSLTPISSVAVHDTSSEVDKLLRGNLQSTNVPDVKAEINKRLTVLVNAMRDDLGVEAMDRHSTEWFPSPPADVTTQSLNSHSESSP
jgi:hypothetical protein